MPNIRSAKKRVVVAESRRLRNAAYKSAIRTQVKKYDTVIAAADKDAAKIELAASVKALDKSVSKGIMHKNCAARKKSKLYKAYNQL
ncbi:MAG: 30S ribosomal protein S20 [Bacillota bacterium]|jgi:small subunit ribosomal protein S20